MASDILQQIIRGVPADFADPKADYLSVRKTMAPFHGHAVGDDVEQTIKVYGGVNCGDYHLQDFRDDGFIALYFHGGALVSCPLSDYHFYAEIISRQLNIRTIMPDYRLAPEQPYPAAHNDGLAVYEALLAQGVAAEKIIVVGESCGGGLAIGSLLAARDRGLAMPAAFVSVTGWFDLSVSDYPTSRDPFLTPEWVQNRGRDFVGQQMPLDDPRISPCYAELNGLPPLFLQVGQYDTMAPSALRLASRATLAGVSVIVESWPSMIHGWHGLISAGVPEAAAAWKSICRFTDRLRD